MAKYKEIVSMVLDLLKVTSDDSIFTEEHIIFLAGRYRSFLLKQKYASDLKKQIPESNYQTICLNLIIEEVIEGLPCQGGYYLSSVEDIPDLLPIGTVRVGIPDSIFAGDIAYVSPDRLRYVGRNKWLENIIYASIANSGKLALKSGNPQYLYLKKATIKGIFENAEEASDLECSTSDAAQCDILDRNFPIEDALIAPLIELVTKELSPSIPAPEDKENNANDNLSPTPKTE